MKNNTKHKIQLFQEQSVRTHWDEKQEKWYFSVVDVIAILTEQKGYQGARNYWKVYEVRKELTDEWQERGMKQGLEYTTFDNNSQQESRADLTPFCFAGLVT